MKSIVIVCGSRRWHHSDAPFIVDRIRRLDPATTILRHGGAQGVDAIVEEHAPRLGFEVQRFAADWQAHGHSAGPRRNQRMLEVDSERVRLVLAFTSLLMAPDRDRLSGTGDMIKQAIAACVPVQAQSEP